MNKRGHLEEETQEYKDTSLSTLTKRTINNNYFNL